MNIKFEKGNIIIDLHDILDRLTKQEIPEFFESISCNDIVIKHVSDQIIHRWTENNYNGTYDITPKPNPTSALDIAWREVAKHSSSVAKEEIARLEKALKIANEKITDFHQNYIHKSDVYNRV